jgi:hypothetical protein
MKVQQNLYIEREIAEPLSGLAAGETGNKSRLVNDALRDWLARRGAARADDLLRLPPDRIGCQLASARRALGPNARQEPTT